MKDVGVKAVYDGEFKNDEGTLFKMFHTLDFAETIAIKASFVSTELHPKDQVRINFTAIPYINEHGKNTAFLAAKVVCVC